MNSRTWRAGALAASITVVFLLATRSVAGQPTVTAGSGQRTAREVLVTDATSGLPAIPESGSLLLLGSAFVVVAQQLRRLT